jgi:hypothetical protein
VTLPLSYSRPSTRFARPGQAFASRASTAIYYQLTDAQSLSRPTHNRHRGATLAAKQTAPPTFQLVCAQPSCAHRAEKVGGEGRVRTSVATWAADLQSAAIDRSATSPKYISCCSSGHDCFGSQYLYPLRPWAAALKPAHVIGVRVSDVSLKGGVSVRGAGGGI